MRSLTHTTTSLAITICVVAIASVIFASPGNAATNLRPRQDYPASCSKFDLNMLPGEAGASIVWTLDHKDCFFGEVIEVTVDTFENGARRDHHVLQANRLDGRTVREVRLSPKPPCSSSNIRVEAKYGNTSIGDSRSTRARVFYDPNDNCGA